jgi:multicomponent Na+:H+ antiporter subunit F
MMNDFFQGAALFLLLTVAAGLFRVLRGPTAADRMLAAQLFGTTGVAVLLLLAEAWNAPELRDVALVFALLAAVIGLAFARRGWFAGMGEPDDAGEPQ